MCFLMLYVEESLQTTGIHLLILICRDTGWYWQWLFYIEALFGLFIKMYSI
jgi:hypothetical protein